jgi:biopolymer transport protein ExbD
MKLRQRDKDEPVVDVGSFSDIAFLLIIFFILTTTFTKLTGNTMSIPSGSTESTPSEDKQDTITLNGEEITYGETSKSMTLDELRDTLDESAYGERGADERMVILQSSDNVSFELYYQVVMAIRNAEGVLALIDEDDKGDEE